MVASGTEALLDRRIKELSQVVKMCNVLFWIVGKWEYRIVKTHQIEYLRTVHFIICKTYLIFTVCKIIDSPETLNNSITYGQLSFGNISKKL